MLPLEFARVSSWSRLTLVIVPGAEPQPVLWTISTSKSLELAMDNLAVREGLKIGSENIGCW